MFYSFIYFELDHSVFVAQSSQFILCSLLSLCEGPLGAWLQTDVSAFVEVELVVERLGAELRNAIMCVGVNSNTSQHSVDALIEHADEHAHEDVRDQADRDHRANFTGQLFIFLGDMLEDQLEEEGVSRIIEALPRKMKIAAM
jgi:hypothetical protein